MIPKDDGFYWAMWLVSDDETDKQYDYTPCHLWEPVELYTNDDGERRVYLGGIPGSQSADGFHWHPEKLVRPPTKNYDRAQQKTEEAVRRYKAMTPAQREEFLAKQRAEAARS